MRSPGEKKEKNLWEKFQRDLNYYQDYEYPKVGIIIPTYNSSQAIAITLESLIEQNYPNFEILIVDAGSDDKTLEIIKGYRNDRIKIYTVSNYNRYEMLNKGISQTNANYINFLFPGDFYLYHKTLNTIMTLALDNSFPDLLFSASLLREGGQEPRILFRHLTLENLKRGKQPTSLQSCWFHESLFTKIGRFSTDYQTRGGYEFFCRFCKEKKLKTVSTRQVLTDYAIRPITREGIIRHFLETLTIIYHYFGFWSTAIWFFVQKDFIRFFKLWWNSFKIALLGVAPE